MSDPINANPTVIDVNNLPTRLNKGGAASSYFHDEENRNKELLEKMISSLSIVRNGDLKSHSSPTMSDSMSSVTSNASSLSISGDSPARDYDEDMDTDPQASSQPLIVSKSEGELYEEGKEDEDLIDEQEIFDLISTISDPEHPLTLAQLAVVNLNDITINAAPTKSQISEIVIKITPTITHCSLATLIGLGIRVRLERSLPARFRYKILIKEGTHQLESQVNKQLNDKERVAAACENEQLLSVISQMLSTCK